jgi:hypothetical protein
LPPAFIDIYVHGESKTVVRYLAKRSEITLIAREVQYNFYADTGIPPAQANGMRNQKSESGRWMRLSISIRIE